MANVDASKDAVLVPDVKAFQKSLHLNAGAFHVFQFALNGFLMMSCPEPVPDAAGDNKKYAKAIFKHIAVKEMSGKWGGSIKQRSTSSWLDSIQREIWDHIPTGRGFSIVHFETFRRGLVRFRWWEYSHRSHRPV